ncbi:hypothetical protein DY000_02039798 [Brassica cretica]|uniref:Uncharacterized protein n=1 Tax=Brassica cretica TaxID=69181 RepID=A0ABQ7B6K7_BRACR|nr:hypothetical protein DY000_02039798 [Brassica cretica]
MGGRDFNSWVWRGLRGSQARFFFVSPITFVSDQIESRDSNSWGLAERHLKPPPLPPVGIKAYQLRVSPPPPPYLPLPPRLSTLSPDHI